MRKIHEVLRLHFDKGLSHRAIGRACKISKNSVKSYLLRFERAGLSWPVSENMDDSKLERLLFKPQSHEKNRPMPDLTYIHQELARKGVTLQLLWKEYRQKHPDGYAYSRFCEVYRKFTRKFNLSMRQYHKAGEKMFVDFAGQTMQIVNPETGELKEAQIFAAVLGASNYTYVEAVPSQDLQNWLTCHIHAFSFFGGVPQIVVPDNLKSAVSKACRYEPDLNPSYHELAKYYGVAVIPARVRKPKDKAKAEVGIQVVQRHILAPLRNTPFFSFTELNQSLHQRLEDLLSKPMKGYGKSRRQLFETIDKPALSPLPPKNYEIAIWKRARVNLDYHVELHRHYYSVHYRMVHKTVELRYTRNLVEIYYQNKRIASHNRSDTPYSHTTLTEHMPKEHQKMLQWTPSRFVRWAKTIGHNTHSMVKRILDSRDHPQQAYRSCLGLLHLEKHYGSERLENACQRAVYFGLRGRKHVLAILKSNQDYLPLPEKDQQQHLFQHHENIRGPKYYD